MVGSSGMLHDLFSEPGNKFPSNYDPKPYLNRRVLRERKLHRGKLKVHATL